MPINRGLVRCTAIDNGMVYLLLCKPKPCMLALQSCLTLCHPMDWSLLVSSLHGILQSRTLEWVAVPSSRGSSQPRNRTSFSSISFTGRLGLFTISATWEALVNLKESSFLVFSSVQFSRSVVSDSLQPHGLQQTRLPCPFLVLMRT